MANNKLIGLTELSVFKDKLDDTYVTKTDIDTTLSATGETNNTVPSSKAVVDYVFAQAQAGLGNVQSDWTETNTSSDAYITNRPDWVKSATKPSYSASEINNLSNAAVNKANILATSRNIDGVSFNGSANVTRFGTCSTAAATAAKTVTITSGTPTLSDGTRITVCFTNGNTSTSNPTLNVNSLGAKSIKFGNNSDSSIPKWKAGTVVDFVYTNNYWIVVQGNIATNTTDGLMSASDRNKLSNIAEGAQVNTVTSVANKTGAVTLTKSDVQLGNVDNKSSATIRGEITSANVTTALGYTPLDAALKGANNGVAELGSNGKILAEQLPSSVDEIIEGYYYNSQFYKESSHTTLITAETSKIYIDLQSNKTYRYSSTQYVEISPSLAIGTTSTTAARGDWGETAYKHSQNTGATTTYSKGYYKIAVNSMGHVTQAESVTASTIENQNAFSNVKIGDTTLQADSPTDTLTVTAGSNITLTPNASSDSFTIAATDTNTTYTVSSPANENTIKLTPSSGSATTVTLKAGTNVTLNGTTANEITISSTDTNTHYTTHLYAGATGATSNATSAVSNPYLAVCDNTTNTGNVQLKAGTNMTISAASGVVTFNNTYSYTHPTTAGNKHIPSGGASNQVLGYGNSSGTAQWVSLTEAYLTNAIASTSELDTYFAT